MNQSSCFGLSWPRPGETATLPLEWMAAGLSQGKGRGVVKSLGRREGGTWLGMAMHPPFCLAVQ